MRVPEDLQQHAAPKMRLRRRAATGSVFRAGTVLETAESASVAVAHCQVYEGITCARSLKGEDDDQMPAVLEIAGFG